MSKEKSKEELEKWIVSWDDIKDAADRLYEHCLYQGYYSDYDYKITFDVYDDGEVTLMLVDRTHGFHHKVHHFKFKYPKEGGRKLIGEKVSSNG